jgi:AraC family transcriptional regulator
MNRHVLTTNPVRVIERTSRTTGGPVDFDQLKRRSWPGLSVENVRIAGPSEYDFRLEVSSNFLMLLDLHRVDGETEVTGGLRTHKKNLRHRLTFVPTGAEISGWSRIIKPAAFTALYFDPRLLDENRCDLSQISPLAEFEDHMLRTTMLQFQAILNDPNLDQPGYAETLAILLAFELGRIRSQLKAPAPSGGGLSRRQVHLVLDHLEGHLSENPTIAELSGLLGLSRFHFIRSFKKAVGMPPHQFIMRRRIERARELLTDCDLSISEIAAQTGFGGVAQLSRAFRQIVGTTPTAFRRGA